MLRVSNNVNMKAGGNRPSFGAFNLVNALCWADKVNTPTQRAVIGSTAAVIQPSIDLNNKKIDEKTRQTSASRSFSRAIIGTISGIAVRSGCFKIAENLTKEGKYLYIDALKKADPKQLDNYIKATGNVMALAVLLVTNFAFDVPLISRMTTYVNRKVFGNEPADANGGAHKEVKR